MLARRRALLAMHSAQNVVNVYLCDVTEDADLIACRASSQLVVHGADLSCAELCCSSVFSVLSHPLFTLWPLSVSPSVIPSSHTLGHCPLISFFSVSLSIITLTISHTTHAAANASILSFFFSLLWLFHFDFLSSLHFFSVLLFPPFWLHSLNLLSPLSPNLDLTLPPDF